MAKHAPKQPRDAADGLVRFPGLFDRGELPNHFNAFRSKHTVAAAQIPDSFAVESDDGLEIGEAGDYVVVDHEGRASVVAAAEFESAFVPVAEAKRDTQAY